MKHQPHFEPGYAALKEVPRICALIEDLDRRIRLLEADIAHEEERVGVSDRFDGAAYSMLARTLSTRRDNLNATKAALQTRLGGLQRQGDEAVSA
jgi:hypothetical protein